MLQEARSRLFGVLRVGIAFAPWLLAMYTLYWLGKNEIWDSETPHRDIMSGGIVATGMAATFIAHTLLAKWQKTKT
ncbi:MAG: hypothetical protein AAF225_08640 [Pseudomonadota bacterium]